MAMEKMIIYNDDGKLARQLLALVAIGKGYDDTYIEVALCGNGITISTVSVNEYGSKWCNDNYTFVPMGDVPFFTAKKLGLV